MWWCLQAFPLFSYRDSQYPFQRKTLNTAARTFCIKQLNTRYFIWMAPGVLTKAACFGFCSPSHLFTQPCESACSGCVSHTQTGQDQCEFEQRNPSASAKLCLTTCKNYDTHYHMPSSCNCSLLWWWPSLRGLMENGDHNPIQWYQNILAPHPTPQLKIFPEPIFGIAFFRVTPLQTVKQAMALPLWSVWRSDSLRGPFPVFSLWVPWSQAGSRWSEADMCCTRCPAAATRESPSRAGRDWSGYWSAPAPSTQGKLVPSAWPSTVYFPRAT